MQGRGGWSVGPVGLVAVGRVSPSWPARGGGPGRGLWGSRQGARLRRADANKRTKLVKPLVKPLMMRLVKAEQVHRMK